MKQLWLKIFPNVTKRWQSQSNQCSVKLNQSVSGTQATGCQMRILCPVYQHTLHRQVWADDCIQYSSNVEGIYKRTPYKV